MWEQIQANRRRSVAMMASMMVILVAMGGVIGGHLAAGEGAAVGLIAGVFLVLILWAVARGQGAEILLSSVDARKITHDDSPVLFNVVQEMTIAAGLPKPPRVFIMDSDAPNAFAVGRPEASAVAVTSGLLMRLNRDELQGVIGHEIGHIRNEDTSFMTLAGIMVGAIILIGETFRRGMLRGSGRRRSIGGGQGAAIVLVAALVFMILAPILARLFYFACSRRREFLADASAAVFTRYPEGLASALEKIAGATYRMDEVNSVAAPMFIVNPLAASEESDLFSTHPPARERVRILRSMAGAGLADYQGACSRVRHETVMKEATVGQAASFPIRAPSAAPEKSDLGKARDTVDIFHRMEGQVLLQCACGLRLKVPPGMKGPRVSCPRCGRENRIPMAIAAGLGAAMQQLDQEESPAPQPGDAPLLYRFVPGHWQSFRCSCGNTIQLSPSFAARRVGCPKCRRTTEIVPA